MGLNKTRAHVHLELCLKLQDDFENWYSSLKLGTPNRHGAYNGLNLAGFDPAPALMQCKDGAEFSSPAISPPCPFSTSYALHLPEACPILSNATPSC
ncbi:MAG: hypothetical protein ACLT8E_03000 [Akkermansia sp.]